SLWGYANDNGNGLISADLRFSDTTTFTGAPVSISGITQPVTPRQSFSFADVTARYVELVPTDNLFGIAPPGGDRVGIGEVAFAVPIPEPSSAVLALLGLAGLARRRR
ncbi:MAG: PEP-CTERM sorting domain-containing protein, partial [Akkermansiaceae bacterium]